MPNRTALVVMARYPEVGHVKTRLAAALGAENACRLYRAFLHDIDRRFAAASRTLVWAFHPPDRDFAAVVAPGARCLPQAGCGLGERMHNCFRALFAEGFERIVMIGADVPHVRDEWLDEAAAALDRADVVLGPTTDGGYYLIAMRILHDVFTGIVMSTQHVLVETRQKAERAGLRVHLLPVSFDVDDESDVIRLRELLTDQQYARWLPCTVAVLDAIGQPQ
jgi:rSAM/selenodomain-associated transferase 1